MHPELVRQLLHKICEALGAIYQGNSLGAEGPDPALTRSLEAAAKEIIANCPSATQGRWHLAYAAQSKSMELLSLCPKAAPCSISLSSIPWARLNNHGDPDFVMALLECGLDPKSHLTQVAAIATRTNHAGLKDFLLNKMTDTSELVPIIFSHYSFAQEDPAFGAALGRRVVETNPAAVVLHVAGCCKHDGYAAIIMMLLCGAKLGSRNLHWFPEHARARLSTIDSSHGRLQLIDQFGEMEDVLREPSRLDAADDFLTMAG